MATSANKLKVLVIMDPLEQINVAKDSSFVIMAEACQRGHEIYTATDADVFASGSDVFAHALALRVSRQEPYFEHLAKSRLRVADMDVVLVRKDPPFDDQYMYVTQLLDLVSDDVFVVNEPRGLQRANEKLYIFNFSEWITPTLVTASVDEVLAFQKEQGGHIVLKPLNLFGGQGIEAIQADDDPTQSKTVIAEMTNNGQQYIMAQRFIAGATKGDKRLTVINGNIEGAVLRVPKAGEWRANLALGGGYEGTEITDRDKQIGAAVRDRLVADGLYLVGLDIVDGFLSEVNVTSPTCFQETEKVSGVCLQAKFWDFIEQRV